MKPGDRHHKLQQLLRSRPMRTAELLSQLGISQPTFSRLWSTVMDGVVVGAGKARIYSLRRPVAGVDAPVPVFRISAAGQVEPIGELTALQGGFYTFTSAAGGHQLFQGMPYFLQDLRPQGFLGRMEPARHADLGLPTDILRWTDDHILQYITRRSEHAPGDLMIGDESYARYLADPGTTRGALIADPDRETRYPRMANEAMQGDPPGSSAGGEQPKFTAVIERTGSAGPGPGVDTSIEHVIVKFSPPTDSASGRRWGDLLVCEHLALRMLAAHGVRAARTAIIEAGGRVFLEVVRFDRVGLAGRLPMATLSAFDGDLGMLDQSWSVVARELHRRGDLAAKDVETVEILDLYGNLIGNTDKHHGNIALSWHFGEPHTLLDAYDMLPMLYRPNTHGEIVARAWTPQLGPNLALKHLSRCVPMALQFWQTVIDDRRISPVFKDQVAAPHAQALQGLAA